ncbi:MAG TPA: tetratricopeptide repeat protein [Anaeromyxobacteraceae bacterium]|nr:tetratricopeptide repeat protein [Anaeromyxobacteraceae bacterium]
MNRPTALLLFLALGLTACKRSDRPSTPVMAAPVTSAPSNPSPGVPPPESLASADAAQRITAAQAVVAQDPKNLEAWVELGNDYFDTHQRERAIEAYGKALEIQPNNPNVLTDQGIMYRELGAFDRAIANFEKANAVEPAHVQSLYNLGVVYAYDLKEKEKALKAWRRLVEVAPTSPQAAEARQAIQALEGAQQAR